MRLRRMLSATVAVAALAVGVTACSKTATGPSVVTTPTSAPTPAVKFFANPPTTASGH